MSQNGMNLRGLREQLGLTMRDVETASARIAQKHGNDEFLIVPSRLSAFETTSVVPSIYRLYSLAVIYRRDLRELLAWYGVRPRLHCERPGIGVAAAFSPFASTGQSFECADASTARSQF